MKVWSVPVIQKRHGVKIIEAETKEEAIEKALSENTAMAISPRSFYELNSDVETIELE